MSHQTSMSFPILKKGSILQVMAELDIPLAEAELIEPGRCKERVREVLCHLLCICWSQTPEQLATLPPRTLAHLVPSSDTESGPSSYPELYREALVETKFFCVLKNLLGCCGYHDFGFKDLQAPSAKRFRKQLSALINFLRYREDMQHLLDTALEERNYVFAALEEMAEEHVSLQDRLEEVKKINRENFFEKEEAEAECLDMESDIAQNNKIQASIRQQNHLLQKSANELKDQIANISIVLRELQAEERQLSKEVVQSPGLIKLEVTNATRDLEDLKHTIAMKEEERRIMKLRLENVILGEESLRNAIKSMEELDEKLREYEIVSENLEDVRCGHETVEKSLDEKKRLIEENGLEVQAIEKQRLDIKTKLTQQLRDAKDELDSAVKRMGTVEKERIDGNARVEASLRRVEEIEAIIAMEKKMTEDEISRRVAKFREFEKVFSSRNDAELNAVIGL